MVAKKAKKSNGIAFSSLFTPELVLCQTTQTNRDAVIMELLKTLASARKIVDIDEAYKAVVDNENSFPSVIGLNTAMPHAHIDSINFPIVGIATSEQGIIYSEENDNPIKLLILILSPKTTPGIYLQVISSLSKICQDPSTATEVANLSSAEAVWDFFNRKAPALPEYVLVSDIMEPVKIKLRENEPLERAIDMFSVRDRDDFPVVDDDDNFIGVVTTYELLRVCLPDYILWMDDLTPISNFEPFINVLRNESKTWLTEIMTSEYASITEDVPAMQAIKEITRHHTSHAYVVRGKKLVGVVSLKDFLRKILRG